MLKIKLQENPTKLLLPIIKEDFPKMILKN
jgi:hypothetical protein